MPVTTLRPTLQLGDKSTAVEELQSLLNLRLANQIVFRAIVPLVVDGDFGSKTRIAVVAYQKQYALSPDGIVGDTLKEWPCHRTWASLLQTCFHDIQGHWAANPICALANMGIVKGDQTGNFNPNAAIARGQFAGVVMTAFESVLPAVRPDQRFSDVPMPARNPITSAYIRGVMSGFEDGTFRPDEGIRRQDMFVSLATILGNFRSGGPNDLIRFEDADTISDYARSAVLSVTRHEIVVNYPNKLRLNPKAFATRGEVAATLERAIVQHVKRQKDFGNILNLGFRVPIEPIETGFTVIVSI